MPFNEQQQKTVNKYQDAGFTLEQAVLLSELEDKIKFASLGMGGLFSQ